LCVLHRINFRRDVSSHLSWLPNANRLPTIHDDFMQAGGKLTGSIKLWLPSELTLKQIDPAAI